MTHASIFSGIGGPEVAADMLGWKNLFHCEINPFCRKVLEYWYPYSISYEDVTKTDFSKWRGRIDVLSGGFPCQPFSYAGKRCGAEDDRYLWPHMLRVIKEVRPTWLVAENVAGITTMVEQGTISEVGSQAALFNPEDAVRIFEFRQVFTIERICEDIERVGYSVQPIVIPACGVGAPHRRDRVFILGRRKDTDTSYSCCHGRQKKDIRTQIERRTPNRKDDEQPQPVFDSAYALLRHPADTSDARAEGMRRERQDEVHRPKHASDTDGEPSERLRPEQSEVGRAQQEQSGGTGGKGGSERLAPHPDSQRGSEVDEHMEPELAEGEKPVSNGRQRNVADPDSVKLHGANGSRWRDFPSVSPVHRGNDGLPFDVDDLSISFSRLRTEALKAYGNAIVPQVIYEIFRAINHIYKNEN